MKIGILTFHCAHNYGAVLQAYALQEYLKTCDGGNEVELIDYRPWWLTRPYEVFPLPRLCDVPLLRKIWRVARWCRWLPRHLMEISPRGKRSCGFEKFISEKMHLSRERFGEEEGVPATVAERYDAIFLGSDQIWNPAITHGCDAAFLGNFPVPAGTLKIAYAASAGSASGTIGDNPVFASALKNFDAISVREKVLEEALQTKTELKVETVLDPTLLVDKSVWDAIAVEPPKTQKKYVLLYQVSFAKAAPKIARELAVQIGAEIVEIKPGAVSFSRNIKNAETPEQFVGWFKNAACVVTTSFHGTAFALINEKPLYYVGNGTLTEIRPRQILRALGLEHRVISDGKTPAFSEIDYAKVNRAEWGGYACFAQAFPRLHFARVGVA